MTAGAHLDIRGHARRWVRKSATATALKHRRLPRVTVDGDSSSQPTVYYVAPSWNEPSGGIRMIYRHVDALNRIGYQAMVLHNTPGFRCTWFSNQTAVVAAKHVQIQPNDVLVIPEFYGPTLDTLPSAARKMIFNQGAYHTFDMIPMGTPVYANIPNLIGILAVSENNESLLNYIFPEVPVWKCRPVVDSNLFYPPDGPKERRYAYIPSRRPEERHQLLHILRERSVQLEPLEIDGLPESDVANELRRCAVFLSFSERDGFGLPPAEAMACGCYVVGYTGGGGEEFFRPEFSRPVSNLLEFAQCIEAAASIPLEELRDLGLAASNFILEKYSPREMERDLRSVFKGLLGG